MPWQLFFAFVSLNSCSMLPFLKPVSQLKILMNLGFSVCCCCLSTGLQGSCILFYSLGALFWVLFSVYDGSSYVYRQAGFFIVAGAYFLNGFVGLFGLFVYSRHVVIIEPQCASIYN